MGFLPPICANTARPQPGTRAVLFFIAAALPCAAAIAADPNAIVTVAGGSFYLRVEAAGDYSEEMVALDPNTNMIMRTDSVRHDFPGGASSETGATAVATYSPGLVTVSVESMQHTNFWPPSQEVRTDCTMTIIVALSAPARLQLTGAGAAGNSGDFLYGDVSLSGAALGDAQIAFLDGGASGESVVIADDAVLCPGSYGIHLVSWHWARGADVASNANWSIQVAIHPTDGPPEDCATSASTDGDQDGVSDALDQCPGTPPQRVVWFDGCIAGDLDGSGCVGGGDLAPFVSQLGSVGSPYDLSTDLNFDGVVNMIDVARFQLALETGCP